MPKGPDAIEPMQSKSESSIIVNDIAAINQEAATVAAKEAGAARRAKEDADKLAFLRGMKPRGSSRASKQADPDAPEVEYSESTAAERHEVLAAERRDADAERGRAALSKAGKYFKDLWSSAKKAFVDPARQALRKVPGAVYEGAAIGVGAGIRGAEAVAAAPGELKDELKTQAGNAVRRIDEEMRGLEGKAQGAVNWVRDKKEGVMTEGRNAVNQIDLEMRGLEGRAQNVVNRAEAQVNGVKNVYRAVHALVGEAYGQGKQQSYEQQWKAYNEQMDAQWDGYMNQWGVMPEDQRNAAWAAMNHEQKYRCHMAYLRAVSRAAEQVAALALAQQEGAEYVTDLELIDRGRTSQASGPATQQMGGMA